MYAVSVPDVEHVSDGREGQMARATQEDFYSKVAGLLPSPQLLFLNYGYADVASESCSWIAPTDRYYKHHLNLVKHVMSGVNLTGRTVLEVGSGRGGNCYYLSRYTRAKKVFGIDRCEAHLR